MAVLRYDIKRNVPATSPPVKLIPKETKLDSSSQSANFLLALCELESHLASSLNKQAADRIGVVNAADGFAQQFRHGEHPDFIAL